MVTTAFSARHDAIEVAIEEQIESFETFPSPDGADVGNIVRRHELEWEYAEHVKGTLAGSISGIKLVIDGANGAASELAPRIFDDLGAQVTAINCTPNGTNTRNLDCGSLHPEGHAGKGARARRGRRTVT